MREFSTGATRNDDENKLDYEGFLNPFCEYVFAQYMHEHRKQADGVFRASDNWQKGMPRVQYLKSLVRHVHELRLIFRENDPNDLEDVSKTLKTLSAIWFNTQGLMLELIEGRCVEE